MELDDCELPEDLSHLISKIGQDAVAQGAFGDVYKCSLSCESRSIKSALANLGIPHLVTKNKVDVAVKVLRILPYDENSMKDVRREMGVWRRIRNEHIVPMLGVANSFASPRISIVSPWQKNGTLTSLLEDKLDMNHKDRLLLLQDIASGLEYLHSVRVVHGDLTGSNVLIDANGRARLTDFGLSSFVNPDEGMTYLAITTRRPGAIRWAAPEVVEDDTHILPTFESDLYSFGSVVLQTLSGCLPWSEIQNANKILKKLCEGCHPARPKSILDAHWDFIMLCMNMVVESRPSAAEVVEWVKEAVSIWDTNTGAANTAPQSTSRLYYRIQLNNYLQSIYGSSVRDHVRWEETEFADTAGAPAWRCVMHIDDMVHIVEEGATKGDAIDTAALHALETLEYNLREQILGWKFRLLNVALCGTLRSHRMLIEPVWVDSAAVATRRNHFSKSSKVECVAIACLSLGLLTLDAILIAIIDELPHLVQLQWISWIVVYLSLLCAFVSMVASFMLLGEVPHRRGAGTIFCKSFIGAHSLVLIHSLPSALLIWGIAFLAAAVFLFFIGNATPIVTTFTLHVMPWGWRV